MLSYFAVATLGIRKEVHDYGGIFFIHKVIIIRIILSQNKINISRNKAMNNSHVLEVGFTWIAVFRHKILPPLMEYRLIGLRLF